MAAPDKTAATREVTGFALGSASALPAHPSGTAPALCLALALACAPRQGPADFPRDDLTNALGALERKVCLTIGDRTNGPRDQCEPRVDRSTYLRPLRDVFVAAPPILKAYLCSMDRLYFDYHSPWNAR